MIVKLNLIGFRRLQFASQQDVMGAYTRVSRGIAPSVARSILDEIETALAGDEAEPAISVAGATVKDLGHVASALKSFGQIAPHETPPRWTSDFIAALGDVRV